MTGVAGTTDWTSPARLPGPRHAIAALLVIVAYLSIGVGPALAAKPALSDGRVTPRTGTTATLFAFSVVFTGNAPPTGIVARLTRTGATTINVALRAPAGGGSGTWSGSRRLPAGTWQVTFVATAPGNPEPLAAGQVIVNRAPTPAPIPTARPTPAPLVTPRPSASHAPTPSPSRSPSSSRSAAASGSAKPPSTPSAIGGATEPSSSPGTALGGTSADDQSGPLLPAVILGLLVIMGVGGIAFLTGRREAEERPYGLPEEAPGQDPSAPEFVRRAAATAPSEGESPGGPSRQRAAWEVYTSLENEPLGTVDELVPGAPPEAEPAESHAESHDA